MSETGQGLLDDGQESDMIPGSDIKNAWGTSICLFFFTSLALTSPHRRHSKGFSVVHANA